MLLRLTLARALAWCLLLSGWMGLGSFALVLAPSVFLAYALVAAWLLALGVAATVGTRETLRPWSRRAALAACGAVTAAALEWSVHGGAATALMVALVGWATLTALASGVVRNLRLAQAASPRPPIGAATLGAGASALALLDMADLQGLAIRLGALVMAAALALAALQRGAERAGRPGRCRAGLFDCSLPAWPAGAWHEARQWPTLMAGLAMLPLMAAMPLMVSWCRAYAVPPLAMVALHLAAMFGPPLLLRSAIAAWRMRTLSTVCAACLAIGATAALAMPPPFDLVGLAGAHGAAWGFAWAGQLWAPARRGRQDRSPMRAALGYALLTLSFGLMVERFGVAGVAVAHTALAAAALLAWTWARVSRDSGDPARPAQSDQFWQAWRSSRSPLRSHRRMPR